VPIQEGRDEEVRGFKLVVSKQTGLPSSGYFVGTAAPGRDMSDLEAAWREDLEAVFARWTYHRT
jgi:hypothetical protein